MKQFSATLFLFFALSHLLFAGNNTGKVIFYRQQNFNGAALNYKIYANDSVICRLSNNSYYVFECQPGIYKFSLDKKPSAKLSLQVESGKVYYLSYGMIMGFWTANPTLTAVDSISAYPIVQNPVIRQIVDYSTPLLRPLNRVGMDFIVGFGFQNTNMISLEANAPKDSASISFGGGFGIGLTYGREINRHFDLAGGILYQWSSLLPNVSNATVQFRRGNLFITPSLIIPIAGGNTMRLRLGAGPNLYFGNTLKLELSDLPGGGSNDKWKYDTALGWHAKLDWESNVSENWTSNIGLTYYGVSYSFASSTIIRPIISDLISPNGNGICLNFGFAYHF